MTPRDTNFAKLVNAMWHGDNVWRDVDNQIRTMNKRLAVWRRAAKEYGISYEMTQRTAYEVLVTMQAIYGAVEKPLATAAEAAPQPAIATTLRVVGEQDGVWLEHDGSIGAAMIWRGEQIVATADDKTDDVQHVSAAA
jgi:ABC-type enterobactin transport system permease subunit